MTQSAPPLTSAQSVALDLYVEHFEEASFLYEQRRDVLLGDPDVAWVDLAATEERLEAHLDALVLGEERALVMCRKQLEEGDAGALYVALCVCCRQDRKDLIDEALGGVEEHSEEQVLAVRDALAANLPDAWTDDILDWLNHSDSWRQRVGVYVVGYRRLPASQHLAVSLPLASLEILPEMIWALGRVSAEAKRSEIWRFLRHENADVQAAAAIALLRLGGQAVVKHVALHRAEPWAMLLLGVSGGPEHRALIHEYIDTEGVTPEGLLALGLLGDLQSVDVLLQHLSDLSHAEASACALHLISGADLFEEIVIPEEIDEDELFDDELDAFRRGESPTRPDGEPFGTTTVRLSQDVDTWKTWWEGKKGHFQLGVRYRLGEPCTPTSIVRALESEKMPRQMRQLLGEELIIRYSLGAYFEADAVVSAQQRGIWEWRQQAMQHEPPFQPGRWYLAGQPL